ncbi:hypothetical protein IW150_005580 [Coemansia sp. RSA 2607]|nr:hypothetical protein IW150_005580 [Coemansia sp. RSA 2607]
MKLFTICPLAALCAAAPLALAHGNTNHALHTVQPQYTNAGQYNNGQHNQLQYTQPQYNNNNQAYYNNRQYNNGQYNNLAHYNNGQYNNQAHYNNGQYNTNQAYYTANQVQHSANHHQHHTRNYDNGQWNNNNNNGQWNSGQWNNNNQMQLQEATNADNLALARVRESAAQINRAAALATAYPGAQAQNIRKCHAAATEALTHADQAVQRAAESLREIRY